MKQTTIEKLTNSISRMRTKVTKDAGRKAWIEGWIESGATGFDEEGQLTGRKVEFRKLREFARIQRIKDAQWLENMDKFLTDPEAFLEC